MSEEGFLSRWAKRKAQVQAGVEDGERPAPHPPSTSSGQAKPLPSGEREPAEGLPAPENVASLPPLGRGIEGEGAAPATPPPPDPPPTMDDVAQLTPTSDFSRFVARGTDDTVKRAALKKLFADPHFNVMDGLDTYIEDFGKADPIPPAMLRRMAQSKFLGLFDDEEKEQQPKASPDGAAPPELPQSVTDHSAVPPDEDPDLRLQQDDAAGPGGAREDPRT
ncbi:DUF3306 domain-containing protein [Piscinibacter sp.]|uniref:DUF3306 domain-containing protein n=1 Tax=Piscinibacter sp. TaxID=1903157 RepID=UPI002CFD1194|nr:DUF3306 domain-containing protein [Albitalea sp.]HUG25073.1 DUF3306 domain-containing protein [Albitalea sp.]